MAVIQNKNQWILAIDPGPVNSAYIEWDGEHIGVFGISDNEAILRVLDYDLLYRNFKGFVIEQVECYGMPVGKSIFETVFWSGRFCEKWPGEFYRMPRKDVKLHLCGATRAKDSNVVQALVDRFAPYERNKGKGTKKEPGFFYGFKKDIWQAFALAVTWYDQNGHS